MDNYCEKMTCIFQKLKTKTISNRPLLLRKLIQRRPTNTSQPLILFLKHPCFPLKFLNLIEKNLGTIP